MIHYTPMTTARKVVGIYTEDIEGGDHILNILPLEQSPIVYSPFSGTFKSTNFKWQIYSDTEDVYIEVDNDRLRCELAKSFKDGDRIEKSEPFVYYSSNLQGLRPIKFSFRNGAGDPVPHNKYSGFPKFNPVENEYYISSDNIYDSYPDFCPYGYEQVIWCYGDTETNEYGVTNPVVRNKIEYVKNGDPIVAPTIEGEFIPTGWISSDTLELYNGEAIINKTIMTAVYNTYPEAKVTVKYKHFNSIEDNESLKVIEISPFYKRPILNRYYYTIIPRCSYHNIELFTLYDYVNIVQLPITQEEFMCNVMCSYNTSYELGMDTAFYPILKESMFNDKEIDIYLYRAPDREEEWHVKYYDDSVETSPPFEIKDGYYVNWLPISITIDDLLSPVIDVKHTSEINRGFVYLGQRGEPYQEDGSIIPILMFLSQKSSNLTDIYNFYKYIQSR